MICLAVSTEFWRVTDGRTDRHLCMRTLNIIIKFIYSSTTTMIAMETDRIPRHNSKDEHSHTDLREQAQMQQLTTITENININIKLTPATE